MNEAQAAGSDAVTIDHLLKASLKQLSRTHQVRLETNSKPPSASSPTSAGAPRFSANAVQVLINAEREASKKEHSIIGTEDILQAMFGSDPAYSDYRTRLKVKLHTVALIYILNRLCNS